jgi:hypothetical protein
MNPLLGYVVLAMALLCLGLPSVEYAYEASDTACEFDFTSMKHVDTLNECGDLCMGAEDTICDLFFVGPVSPNVLNGRKSCLFRTNGCAGKLIKARNWTTYRVTQPHSDAIVRIILPSAATVIMMALVLSHICVNALIQALIQAFLRFFRDKEPKMNKNEQGKERRIFRKRRKRRSMGLR